MKTTFRKKTSEYSHFLSLPILDQKIKKALQETQKHVLSHINQSFHSLCTLNNPNLFHITLCMLNLREFSRKSIVSKLFHENNQEMANILRGHQGKLIFDKITCFSLENKKHTKKNDVIYLEPQKNETLERIHELSDLLIKSLIKSQIVDSNDLTLLNLFKDHLGRIRTSHYHLTLVRMKEIEKIKLHESLQKIQEKFQKLEIPLEFVDVSTRFEYEESKFYKPLIRWNVHSG